jgi:hypothetical protein
LQIKRTRHPLCQTVPSLDTAYGTQAICVSANLWFIPAKLNYRKAAIAERLPLEIIDRERIGGMKRKPPELRRYRERDFYKGSDQFHLTRRTSRKRSGSSAYARRQNCLARFWCIEKRVYAFRLRYGVVVRARTPMD